MRALVDIMESLSPNLLAAGIVWAAIAAYLYHRQRALPDYTYDELRRTPLSPPPPEYRWYYSIPAPMFWADLAFSCGVMAGILHMRHQPESFWALLDAPSSFVKLIHGVSADTLAVIPLLVLWIPVLFWLSVLCVMAALRLLSFELSHRFFPKYHLSNATVPHRFAKRARQEISNAIAKPEKQERGRTLILLGLLLGAAITRSLDATSTIPLLCIAAFLILSLPSLNRERVFARLLKNEILKRFDLPTLVALQRGQNWIAMFRTWILLPLSILLFAHMATMYTFDNEGLRHYDGGKQSTIPWSRISSLQVGFDPAPSGTDKTKPRHPELIIKLVGPDAEIDLNEGSTLSMNPELTRRVIAEIRHRNISIECASHPTGEEQARALLESSTRDESVVSTDRLIEQLCPLKS